MHCRDAEQSKGARTAPGRQCRGVINLGRIRFNPTHISRLPIPYPQHGHILIMLLDFGVYVVQGVSLGQFGRMSQVRRR